MAQDLAEIFREAKPLLARYAPPLTVRVDDDRRYDLWSEKEVVIEGRKRKEVAFASLIIQGKYVGFYFMPVYTDVSLGEVFRPQLLKLLKGKSCFHLRKLDGETAAAIEEALEVGFRLYQERGWI